MTAPNNGDSATSTARSPCANIIVIEDDEAIRESVTQILEFEGYHVVSYANGKEAVDGLANCDDPCLILLDLMMPVMNGWQFLEARKTFKHAITAIPVIIVSAWADQAKDAQGIAGYMKKPVDVDVLLRIVEKHCQGRAKVA